MLYKKATEISLNFLEVLKRFLTNGGVGFKHFVTAETTEAMGHRSLQQHSIQRLV